MFLNEKESKSQLIGLVTLFPTHNSMYMCNLCIDPQWRKFKCASFLMRICQNECVKRKILKITGSVDYNRNDLLSLYKSKKNLRNYSTV